MVKKGNNWYNYNIRGEKKEKQFDSKESGLQKIWSDAVKTEAVGGAIAGTLIKNKKIYVDENGHKYYLKKDKRIYVQ